MGLFPTSAGRVSKDEPEQHGHAAVYKDFHRAIREGGEPRCNGEEGLKSLELANAMIYSGATGEAVSLPLDRKAYSELLERLQAGGCVGIQRLQLVGPYL